MRVVLWNCNNGLGSIEQIEYFFQLKPDLAIIPELKEQNIEMLKPTDHVWATNAREKNSPKGLGVLSFGGSSLTLEDHDPEMEIYLPITIEHETLEFRLLAVWNFYWAAKQGRFKNNKVDPVEYAALSRYQQFLTDPCIIAGDWNLGPTYSSESYKKIARLFQEQDIRNIYNTFHNLEIGSEKHQTFRPARGGKVHILDHIFGSQSILNATEQFWVADPKDWVKSDHAPILLDIDIESVKNSLQKVNTAI